MNAPDHDNSSQGLDKLRMLYEAGVLSKRDYNCGIWEIHHRLFEYPRFLRNTNVDAIEINEDGVVAQLRDRRLKLWCTP